MNVLSLVVAYLLGGASVIVIGIIKVESFFDRIREILDMLMLFG